MNPAFCSFSHFFKQLALTSKKEIEPVHFKVCFYRFSYGDESGLSTGRSTVQLTPLASSTLILNMFFFIIKIHTVVV